MSRGGLSGLAPADTIWRLSETLFVAVATRFVAVLSLICLTVGCFRYDWGVFRETAVTQFEVWRRGDIF